jgi:DNA-binding MarR family transcriptional regulator
MLRPVPLLEDHSLGLLIGEVVRLLRADFATRAAGTSLTPALWRLLFHVSRNEGGRQTDFAERMELTPVTIGRMIDRLEKQQLLRRVADATDRRASRVYLGRRAQPMLDRLQAIAAETNERAMTGLPPAEREALLGALRRVRTNLQDSGIAPVEVHVGGGHGR